MIFATLSRVLLVPVRYWFPRLAYQVVQYEAPAQAVRAVRGRVLEPSVLVETLLARVWRSSTATPSLPFLPRWPFLSPSDPSTVFEDDYCLQNDAQQPLTPNACVNMDSMPRHSMLGCRPRKRPTFVANCNMIICPQARFSLFCR
jgi:hypothetical protein